MDFLIIIAAMWSTKVVVTQIKGMRWMNHWAWDTGQGSNYLENMDKTGQQQIRIVGTSTSGAYAGFFEVGLWEHMTSYFRAHNNCLKISV